MDAMQQEQEQEQHQQQQQQHSSGLEQQQHRMSSSAQVRAATLPSASSTTSGPDSDSVGVASIPPTAAASSATGPGFVNYNSTSSQQRLRDAVNIIASRGAGGVASVAERPLGRAGGFRTVAPPGQRPIGGGGGPISQQASNMLLQQHYLAQLQAQQSSASLPRPTRSRQPDQPSAVPKSVAGSANIMQAVPGMPGMAAMPFMRQSGPILIRNALLPPSPFTGSTDPLPALPRAVAPRPRTVVGDASSGASPPPAKKARTTTIKNEPSNEEFRPVSSSILPPTLLPPGLLSVSPDLAMYLHACTQAVVEMRQENLRLAQQVKNFETLVQQLVASGKNKNDSPTVDPQASGKRGWYRFAEHPVAHSVWISFPGQDPGTCVTYLEDCNGEFANLIGSPPELRNGSFSLRNFILSGDRALEVLSRACTGLPSGSGSGSSHDDVDTALKSAERQFFSKRDDDDLAGGGASCSVGSKVDSSYKVTIATGHGPKPASIWLTPAQDEPTRSGARKFFLNVKLRPDSSVMAPDS